MSKTIKQIAEELGVSKQAVYKRYKGKLYSICSPYSYTDDKGVLYLNDDAELIIKEDFSYNLSGIGVPLERSNNDVGAPLERSNNDVGAPLEHSNNDVGAPLEHSNNDVGAPLEHSNNDVGVPLEHSNNDIGVPLEHSNNDIGAPLERSNKVLPNVAIDVLINQSQILTQQLNEKDKLITQLQFELAAERQHSRNQSDQIADLADKIHKIANQSQQLQLAQIASSEQTLKLEHKKKLSFLSRIFSRGNKM